VPAGLGGAARDAAVGGGGAAARPKPVGSVVRTCRGRGTPRAPVRVVRRADAGAVRRDPAGERAGHGPAFARRGGRYRVDLVPYPTGEERGPILLGGWKGPDDWY